MHPLNAGRKHQSKPEGEILILRVKNTSSLSIIMIKVSSIRVQLGCQIYYQGSVASVSQWSDDKAW